MVLSLGFLLQMYHISSWCLSSRVRERAFSSLQSRFTPPYKLCLPNVLSLALGGKSNTQLNTTTDSTKNDSSCFFVLLWIEIVVDVS
jgi:hypothetical protein